MSYSILPQFQEHTAKWSQDLTLLSEQTQLTGLSPAVICKCSEILQDVQSHLRPVDFSSKLVTTGSVELAKLQKKVEAVFTSAISWIANDGPTIQKMKSYLNSSIASISRDHPLLESSCQDNVIQQMMIEASSDLLRHHDLQKLEKDLHLILSSQFSAHIEISETFWHQLIRFLDIDAHAFDPLIENIISREMANLDASKLLDLLSSRQSWDRRRNIPKFVAIAAERGSFALSLAYFGNQDIDCDIETIGHILLCAIRYNRKDIVESVLPQLHPRNGFSYLEKAKLLAKELDREDLFNLISRRLKSLFHGDEALIAAMSKNYNDIASAISRLNENFNNPGAWQLFSVHILSHDNSMLDRLFTIFPEHNPKLFDWLTKNTDFLSYLLVTAAQSNNEWAASYIFSLDPPIELGRYETRCFDKPFFDYHFAICGSAFFVRQRFRNFRFAEHIAIVKAINDAQEILQSSKEARTILREALQGDFFNCRLQWDRLTALLDPPFVKNPELIKILWTVALSHVTSERIDFLFSQPKDRIAQHAPLAIQCAINETKQFAERFISDTECPAKEMLAFISSKFYLLQDDKSYQETIKDSLFQSLHVLFATNLNERSVEYILKILQSYHVSTGQAEERGLLRAGLQAKNAEIVLCLVQKYKQHFPLQLSDREVLTLDDIFIKAAENGLLQVVYHFMRNDLILDPSSFQKGFEAAAIAGHLGICLQLSQLRLRLSKDCVNEALIQACKRGDLEMVDLILSQNVRPSQPMLYQAMTIAAEGGHLAIFQALYFEFSLSDKAVLEAVLKKTVKSNLFEIWEFALDLMIEADSQFTASDAFEAMVAEILDQSVAYDNMERIDALVRRFPRLASKVFLPAMESAISHGKTLYLDSLLKKNTLLTFLDTVELLVEAIRNGHEGILSQVVEAGMEKPYTTPSPTSLQESLKNEASRRPAVFIHAINTAIEKQAKDCITILMENGRSCFNAETLTALASTSIASSNFSLFEKIMQHSPLLDDHATFQIIKAATLQGKSVFATHLLTLESPLSSHSRDQLILLASRKGHVDIVRLLLLRGPISRAIRGSAMTLADTASRTALHELFSHAAVEDEPTADPGAIEVSLGYLKDDPETLLEILSCMQSLPRRFRLTESRMAVDAGGVSKDVITTLFSAIDERYKNLWTEKRCVLVDMQEQRSAATLFKNMAKVISLIYKANADKDDPLLIGPLFHEGFFSLIKTMLTISDEKALHKAVANILKEAIEDYDPLWQVITAPSESTKQAFNEFATMILCLDEEQSQEEHIRSLMTNFLAPIDVFIEGLSPALQERIITCSETLLLKSIQGDAITPEAVLKALEIAEGQSSHFYTSCDWIKEKISSSDIEWLKRFVYTITGRALLTPSTKINIRCFGRGDFEIHTCFNSLDIPRQPLLKQDFLSAIDNIINDSKYNVA